MKKSVCLLISLFSLLMVSCGDKTSESSISSESGSESVPSEPITDVSYVQDVSLTAPILVSGMFQGEAVDYVVSSQPVIYASSLKNSNFSIYANVAEEFGKKYECSGFPQAGLFIKASLLEDPTKLDSIHSFLATFDQDVSDLIQGGTKASSYLNEYDENPTKQTERFGFNSNVLTGVQKDNGLAFIENKMNPSVDELKNLSSVLNIDLKDDDFSSLYLEDTTSYTPSENLDFSIITPKGAPSAVFSRYGKDDKVDFAAPAQVSATFSKADKDFIIFDSVNGAKLSRKNNNSYKLVRMVTFGNLYVIDMHHDEDGKMSQGDKIISYGEGLVPDLAFKAVFSA